MMSRTLTIKFSLVRESKKRTSAEILKEISEAFSKDDLVIPWCDKVEEISLTETRSKPGSLKLFFWLFRELFLKKKKSWCYNGLFIMGPLLLVLSFYPILSLSGAVLL